MNTIEKMQLEHQDWPEEQVRLNVRAEELVDRKHVLESMLEEIMQELGEIINHIQTHF